ncbi:MAG: ATP-binding protein [Aliidongia sp.]
MVARGKLVIGIIDISAATKARVSLEASERRYRSLFRLMPVSLIQLDRGELAGVFEDLQARGVRDFRRHLEEHPDFTDFALNSIKIREVNRRTLELFGAGDADQLLGPVARLWTENRAVFERSMQARYEGATGFDAEIQIRSFDGSLRNVLYVTDFPEALRHEPLGLACLIDITDRVKAQEMLTQVQAEFAHAARVSMLGELTASIAHEVNQPLGAILTNAEAALRWLDRPEPDLDELRALSIRTAADARRAADIIRRIRSMAVRQEPEQGRVALNGVVKDVALFLGPELQRQGIEAVLELAPDLPDVVADRVQLQQVVANIAINATQAMKGSTERRLTIRTGAPDQGTLRIEIEDTGPGIAADHLGHLFESFFSTKPGGMGIGLAICRSILEAHGGSIAAINLPEGGARFRVALPACHTEV